jgi:hypothetical protein
MAARKQPVKAKEPPMPSAKQFLCDISLTYAFILTPNSIIHTKNPPFGRSL